MTLRGPRLSRLPELVALLETLADLPLVVAEIGGERWPVIVLLFIALGVWLIRTDVL